MCGQQHMFRVPWCLHVEGKQTAANADFVLTFLANRFCSFGFWKKADTPTCLVPFVAMTLKKRDSCCHFNMVILSLKVAGIVLLTCLKVTYAQDQLVRFAWLSLEVGRIVLSSVTRVHVYKQKNDECNNAYFHLLIFHFLCRFTR